MEAGIPPLEVYGGELAPPLGMVALADKALYAQPNLITLPTYDIIRFECQIHHAQNTIWILRCIGFGYRLGFLIPRFVDLGTTHGIYQAALAPRPVWSSLITYSVSVIEPVLYF